MKISVFSTKQELDSFAAGKITAMVANKPNAVLGLATGSTPVGIYEKIVENHRRDRISFRNVISFNLDEYVGLPPLHEQSYACYMRKHLFAHIDISAKQSHLPDGMAQEPQHECTRYDRMLAEHPVDLQLLGLGHNGHIGFNEPGGSLFGGTHIVELKAETRQANARFFDSLEQVPRFAITMGVGSILKARSIILAVSGADKADILREALIGPITTACPASLLQTHADVTILADQEAGRKIADVIRKDPYAYR
jgi:glucosamine-6-phosphate deaminase